MFIDNHRLISWFLNGYYWLILSSENNSLFLFIICTAVPSMARIGIFLLYILFKIHVWPARMWNIIESSVFNFNIHCNIKDLIIGVDSSASLIDPDWIENKQKLKRISVNKCPFNHTCFNKITISSPSSQ